MQGYCNFPPPLLHQLQLIIMTETGVMSAHRVFVYIFKLGVTVYIIELGVAGPSCLPIGDDTTLKIPSTQETTIPESTRDATINFELWNGQCNMLLCSALTSNKSTPLLERTLATKKPILTSVSFLLLICTCLTGAYPGGCSGYVLQHPPVQLIQYRQQN